MSPEQIQTYAPLIAIAIAVPLILLRNRKPRRLNVDRLWIIPAVVTAAVGVGLVFGRPPGVTFTVLEAVIGIAGAGLGAIVGWWRGKLMRLDVNVAERTVSAQTSPIGLLFILAVLALRTLLRTEMENGVAALDFNPAFLVEALLLFAVGTVVAQRLELWIRARRLLAGKTR